MSQTYFQYSEKFIHDVQPWRSSFKHKQYQSREGGEKIKFLGVIFDEKLSFKFHFEELLSKLSRVVGISYKSRYLVPEAVLRTLYLSLGWSHMSYGVVIWGMANQTCRNKLQLLQNKIIINIHASNNLSTYKRNGLLRFMVSSNYFVVIILYKEINNIVWYHISVIRYPVIIYVTII